MEVGSIAIEKHITLNLFFFQPMIQEYYEFSPRIDELNDVGNAYDAIQSGESRPRSPMKFSKLLYMVMAVYGCIWKICD